jgi:hypothetical protein
VRLKVVVELASPRGLVAVGRIKMVLETLSEPTRFVPFRSLTGQSNADDGAAHHKRVDPRDMP